jgi:hypothetical protein
LVRFTLRAEDFERWPDIAQQFPAWTPVFVKVLERAAIGKEQPALWRCRVEPLPRS